VPSPHLTGALTHSSAERPHPSADGPYRSAYASHPTADGPHLFPNRHQFAFGASVWWKQHGHAV